LSGLPARRAVTILTELGRVTMAELVNRSKRGATVAKALMWNLCRCRRLFREEVTDAAVCVCTDVLSYRCCGMCLYRRSELQMLWYVFVQTF
jgi:hypothetical protein